MNIADHRYLDPQHFQKHNSLANEAGSIVIITQNNNIAQKKPLNELI
jgi:hypothetical protein